MTAVILKILLAYLLGSVSGSLLIGRLRKVDIRTQGSGNAGGTNAFRTQGLLFALGVVVIDIGKGALAAAVVPGLAVPPGAPIVSAEVLVLVCGLAAVVGHCYPAWHGFNGGKGAATSVGVLLVINPWLLAPLAVTWLATLALTGYVGLATVLAAFSVIPLAAWQSGPGPQLLFVVVLAVFIAFTHRGNFRKMARGGENRFERARIFGRGKRPGEPE